MNLSLKRIKIFNNTGLLVLLGALFFLSCKDSTELLLEEGEDVNKIGTYLIDTFSVSNSTVVLPLDSTISETRVNARKYLLFGQYNDPELGEIKAQGYTEVERNYDASVKSTDQLVSFELLLDLDYVRGEKAANQEIFVYPLADTINSIADYNISSSVPVNENALLNEKTSFNISEAVNGKVRFKLKESLGEQFLTEIKNKSANFLTDSAFRNYFLKGITIKGGINNSAIFGADTDSSRIVLKYRSDTVIKEINFAITARYLHFNHIDRPTVPLNEQKSFIQSSTGITSEIRIPGFRNLKSLGKNIAVNQAEIIITPDISTDTVPPRNLFLLRYPGSKFDTLIKDDTRNYSGTTALFAITNYRTVQGGVFGGNQKYNISPVTIPYYTDVKQYRGDITSYVDALIRFDYDLPFEFLLYPEAAGNAVNKRFSYSIGSGGAISTFNKDLTINRAVIPKGNIKIKIYYTVIGD